jgi:DNA-binding LacI/PurR family transcriptional regulator
VSNVLNAPERVSPQVREHVEHVIRELGYRPNAMARSLSLGTTGLVAFRVGDGKHNETSLLDPFMRELARIGERFGYRLVLDYADDDDDAQIEAFRDLVARRSVDGVVLTETHHGDRRPNWLLEHGVPFVAFGRPWDDQQARHIWVDVDVRRGLQLVVEHLVAKGHQRIAFVGSGVDLGRNDSRIAGWRETLERLVPGVDASALQVRGDRGSVAEPVAQMIGQAKPTAIACQSDAFALEVDGVLRRMGLRVGRDVALVGFDDSALARQANPPLTSVAQPITEIAEHVWEGLLPQLQDLDSDGSVSWIAEPTLVVRQSSDFVLAPAE